MKKFTSLLLSIILLGTISCAHVKPTEPSKKDKPAKEHVSTSAWHKFKAATQPKSYDNWNPWKKFVWWLGPGH